MLLQGIPLFLQNIEVITHPTLGDMGSDFTATSLAPSLSYPPPRRCRKTCQRCPATAGSSPLCGGGYLPGGGMCFGGCFRRRDVAEVRRRVRHGDIGGGWWRRPCCCRCELQARFYPSGPELAYGVGLLEVGKRGDAWWRCLLVTVVVLTASQAAVGWIPTNMPPFKCCGAVGGASPPWRCFHDTVRASPSRPQGKP
jgi:hypothetical protein